MGLVASRWNTRNDTGWLTRDDDIDGGSLTKAGVRVNRASALSLTTVYRCWDLLSSSVAQSPRDVIVKIGGKSFPEFNPPGWVEMPNPADPTYTASDHFAQVGVSLLSDGNFFTAVYPHVYAPEVLKVLDPARVVVRPGPLFDVMDDSGKVIATLGPAQMLHGTWLRLPGALRGVGPLEALRLAFGAALATQETAARFFGQGATMSFGVEVPGPLDAGKKDELSASLRKKYAGVSNSHAIGVLTHGAKFVTGLAPTPEQAQFLDTRKFGVEEVCRIYGVPPGMVGSQEPGASSYASAHVNAETFRDRAVLPLATRIEAQYKRLLTLPAGLEQGSIQFKFNLDGIARMDLLSRYQAYEVGVRGGIDTPNEARALEDKSPLPGGDVLYMQQQMAPITSRVEEVAGLVRAGFDPAAALAALGLPPIKHTGLVPVTVQGENVATAAAPAPAPAVRSEPTIVQHIHPTTIEDGAFRSETTVQPANAAAVTVENHVEPATVNVEPAQVRVEPTVVNVTSSAARSVKSIDRDEKGFITRIVEEPDGE